jgi:hypothetical protein
MLVLGVFELCANVCVKAPETGVLGRHPEVLVELRIIDCYSWIDFGYKYRGAVIRPEFSRGK